jgi:serine/threonine-protein phosphatase 2A regulatory subunit A
MNSNDLSKIIDHLENLKSDDVKKRLSSVQNLNTIAEVFGVEKTRTKLLPFLKEFKDDEEEILIQLAIQLKYLGDKICETENFVADIIPYFYICFNYEDMSVIEEAARSLNYLVKKYNLVHESIIVLAKKLQQTGFTKCIIASIIIVSELNEFIPLKYQGEVNKIITESVESKITIIRKYAAKYIRFLLAENGAYNSLALKSLKTLSKDSQDIVQVLTTETLCSHLHSKLFFNSSIYPIIQTLYLEISWRIKYAITNGLYNILSSVQNNTKKEILKYFLSYLQDEEPEVSIAAFKILKKIHNLIEPEFIIENLLKIMKWAKEQKNLQIKKMAASSLPYLSLTLGKNNTNKYLKEIIMEYLKDNQSCVQSEILENLEPLTETLSFETIYSMISPNLSKLINDNDWNIRKSSIQTYEILLKKNQKDEEIIKSIRERLCDRVFEVRNATIEMLAKVSRHLGSDFADNFALPIFFVFHSDGNYLYRLNYLFGINVIYDYLSPDVQKREILNIVKLGKDRVSNIKLNAVLSLLKIYVKKENEEIKENLLKMVQNDKQTEDHDLGQIYKKLTVSNFKQNIEKILYNY